MNAHIIPAVEQAVLERLHSKVSFTSLDISNALKADGYSVKHSDTALVVRDIYQSGGMDFYGYRRRLIDVVAGRGRQPAKAFLYHHDSAAENDYTARAQTSLPSVGRDQARALPSVAVAGQLLSAQKRHKPNAPLRRGTARRDGALAVPVGLIAQLGWGIGEPLQCNVQAGIITVSRTTPGSPARLHLWRERRIRLCAKTLRKAGLMAPDVRWRVEHDALLVTTAT